MRTTTTRILDLCDLVKTFIPVLLVAGVAITALPDPALTPTSSTIAPVAVVTDLDATAEGTDVLPLSFYDAPADLWNALAETLPTAYDDDVPELPGMGTFYVPVGTVVDVPGGLYLATIDGFAECRDFQTFDSECSATGPVQMLDVPTRPASSFTPFTATLAVENI